MRDSVRDSKLCYAEHNFLWFTTAPLKQQWGDDWDDAPYEHNAGRPYEYREYMASKGVEPYELFVIAYMGEAELPCSGFGNSPYSVLQINKGVVAWAVFNWYMDDPVPLYAGDKYEDVLHKLEKAGVDVFVRKEWK